MLPAFALRVLPRLEHRQILGGMLAIAGLAGVAKIIGAAKEIVVAAHFGTGPDVDAYQLLFSLLSWPTGVLTGVAATVIIPLLVKADLSDAAEGLRFRRELWGATLLVSLGLGVLAAALTWAGAAGGWLGADAGMRQAVAQQALPLALMLPFAVAFVPFGAFLIADRKPINNLLEATPAAIIVLALFAAPASGPWALVAGTVVGMALQLALGMLLQAPERRVVRPSLDFRSPHWRVLAASVGVVLLSQAMTGVTSVFDQLWAADLGSGANAALGYAGRLTSLAATLGATAVARATLPVFARLGVEAPEAQARMARQWSAVMGGLGLVAVVVGWAAAPFAVELLFQRGAFTAEDTQLVTEVLRYSLIQLPFYFSSMVLVQQLASNGRFSAFLKIGLINLVTKVAALAVLAPTLGLAGIALSTAVMYAVGRVAIGRLARAPS